jgi:hypothetical protein
MLAMITPLGIFGFGISNEMLWIEAAADLETAKGRVAELMQANPCEYLIFSQQTGQKISIEATALMAIVRGKYAIRQWRNS